jgi:hypothetical protein
MKSVNRAMSSLLVALSGRSSHPLSAHAALQQHFLLGFVGVRERSENRHRRES